MVTAELLCNRGSSELVGSKLNATSRHDGRRHASAMTLTGRFRCPYFVPQTR
jgi:hypothetical protein